MELKPLKECKSVNTSTMKELLAASKVYESHTTSRARSQSNEESVQIGFQPSKLIEIVLQRLPNHHHWYLTHALTEKNSDWSNDERAYIGRCIAILLKQSILGKPEFMVCARSIGLVDEYNDVELGTIIRAFDEHRTYASIDCHAIYKYIRDEYVNDEGNNLLCQLKSGLKIKWNGSHSSDLVHHLAGLILEDSRHALKRKRKQSNWDQILDMVVEDVWTEDSRASALLEELATRLSTLESESVRQQSFWKVLEIMGGSVLSSEWPHLTRHLQRRTHHRAMFVYIIHTHTRLPKDLAKLVAEYAF